MYMVVKTNHSMDSTHRSFRSNEVSSACHVQAATHDLSASGGALHQDVVASRVGVNGGSASRWTVRYNMGDGVYRKSDAYLSIVPAVNFETGQGTRYFAGLNAAGKPIWSESESDATPIVRNGTMGDLSVTWCKDLSLWFMTYDSREPNRGIAFSYSRTPWGPWSEPQIIFNATRDGALGKFIHDPSSNPNDGLAGPVIGKDNKANPGAVHGGAYAPYVVERWTRLRGAELDLYYVLSTWNPYVVVLMKSRLRVE